MDNGNQVQGLLVLFVIIATAIVNGYTQQQQTEISRLIPVLKGGEIWRRAVEKVGDF